jgi:hypothetical protein
VRLFFGGGESEEVEGRLDESLQCEKDRGQVERVLNGGWAEFEDTQCVVGAWAGKRRGCDFLSIIYQ